MGHYPIKCIRCSHVMTNDTVLFDTKNAIRRMKEILNDEKSASSSASETFRTENEAEKPHDISVWDDDNENVFDTADAQSAAAEELSDYMSFPEIQRYCESRKLDPCIPKYQKIDVTPDFQTDDPGDLLVGVTFQKEKGNAVVYANRRFCPACRCELPLLSGSMPTYNITVMGTSSSGKTVYLCALNWLLSQNQGTLPYNCTLTCVSANQANNDLVSRSNELFMQGVLPGTTQIVLTEPLTIQMTFRIGGKMKKCLVAMSDMRGEDFSESGGENLTARSEFFSSADAFMLLVSPLNMPYIQKSLPDMRDHDDSDMSAKTADGNVHQSLMSNINNYILPFFPNGQIDAPCAIMMSKCDILMNYADRLRIPRSNAVVAAEPPFRYTRTYFMSQDSGTRTIVGCDNILYPFLQNTFRRSYFTSFSSLGQNVTISEDEDGNRRIQNPNLLHPIRVVDPIVYLLMSLGFLPPYYRMEVGNHYDASNREILSMYMRDHL